MRHRQNQRLPDRGKPLLTHGTTFVVLPAIPQTLKPKLVNGPCPQPAVLGRLQVLSFFPSQRALTGMKDIEEGGHVPSMKYIGSPMYVS